MIRNKLSSQTDAQRLAAYERDCAKNARAWYADGLSRELRQVNVNAVEFIGGLWRIQRPFSHTIYPVRDRNFVLLEKLNRLEKNLFEYYTAIPVGLNCYGYTLNPEMRQIVAKYETDDETFWAYGDTIEQARAFLGIRLYDKYMDVIHMAACRKKLHGDK